MTATVAGYNHAVIVEMNSPIRKILAEIGGFGHRVGFGVQPLDRHLVSRYVDAQRMGRDKKPTGVHGRYNADVFPAVASLRRFFFQPKIRLRSQASTFNTAYRTFWKTFWSTLEI